jgi:hypothetical protein
MSIIMGIGTITIFSYGPFVILFRTGQREVGKSASQCMRPFPSFSPFNQILEQRSRH